MPDVTYDRLSDASFNEELDYRGYGKYRTAYEARMKRLQDSKDDLDKKENRIYANIITLMGIFVSIFSLIMVDFTQAGSLTGNALVRTNLSLGFVILLFLGAILLFINQKNVKNRSAADFVYLSAGGFAGGDGIRLKSIKNIISSVL